MSMEVTRVHSWWTAEQADDVLSCLDELRDALWSSYGDQIVGKRQSNRVSPVSTCLYFMFHGMRASNASSVSAVAIRSITYCR